MATTSQGVVYPLGSADDNVPADMLAMANSLNPKIVGNYTSMSALDTAMTPNIAAGAHPVAHVDGLGLVYLNQFGDWVNLTPPRRFRLDHSYGTGAVAEPGSTYTDPAGVTINNLLNGQEIDVEIQAAIRVDGTLRNTVLIGVNASGSVQSTSALTPEMAQQDYGDGNEYKLYTRKLSFFADNGTTVLKVTVDAGLGPRLVMKQAQMWVTVHPLDAG